MTTRRLSLIALLILAVPMTLAAQRGGGGGGSRRGFGAGGGSSEADALIRDLAESPSLSKDLQKANPIEMLLDKKKDLAITKDEEKELKALNDALKESTKPYFRTIDSVSKEEKKPGDYAPTQGQLLIGRRLKKESSDSVFALYRAAAEQAVGKLATERQQPASDLLQKELEAQAASRRGSRGGRPPA